MKNTLPKNSLGLERVIWLLILAIFTSLALYWSYDVFDQWQAYPVLTSVKTTGTIGPGSLNCLIFGPKIFTALFLIKKIEFTNS